MKMVNDDMAETHSKTASMASQHPYFSFNLAYLGHPESSIGTPYKATRKQV